MYQLTNNPEVLLCLETKSWVHRDSYLWPTEWLLENDPLPVPPPYELHSPAHYKAIRDAAWAWMLEVVQARRYDSIETCCSYFNSSVERYRLEAHAMVAWRDAINQKLETLVSTRPEGIETWEQVKALLPQPQAYDWPEEVDLPLGAVPPITVAME